MVRSTSNCGRKATKSLSDLGISRDATSLVAHEVPDTSRHVETRIPITFGVHPVIGIVVKDDTAPSLLDSGLALDWNIGPRMLLVFHRQITHTTFPLHGHLTESTGRRWQIHVTHKNTSRRARTVEWTTFDGERPSVQCWGRGTD